MIGGALVANSMIRYEAGFFISDLIFSQSVLKESEIERNLAQECFATFYFYFIVISLFNMMGTCQSELVIES